MGLACMSHLTPNLPHIMMARYTDVGPKENWAIKTAEAFYPGFKSQKEAEDYAKSKKWTDVSIVKLAD